VEILCIYLFLKLPIHESELRDGHATLSKFTNVPCIGIPFSQCI